MEQLSPWATTIEPMVESSHAVHAEAHSPKAHAQQQEKSQQWEACTLQWRVAPTPLLQLEKVSAKQ